LEPSSLADRLLEIAQRDPQPRIDVGLIDRNRNSLDHWQLERDCLVGFGPGGAPRFLIPLAQVVIVEIAH
jgi:hypothetical protein